MLSLALIIEGRAEVICLRTFFPLIVMRTLFLTFSIIFGHLGVLEDSPRCLGIHFYPDLVLVRDKKHRRVTGEEQQRDTGMLGT